MEIPRVVVTGIGIVAANGVGRDKCWSAVKAGITGINTVKAFDVSIYRCQIAGEVKGFTDDNGQDADRASKFILAAAREAVVDAGFDALDDDARDRVGVVLGTIHGGLITAQTLYKNNALGSSGKITSHQLWQSGLSAPSWHIAREFNLKGPRSTITMACASGTAAVGYGFSLIRQGRADVVLTGGVDTVNQFIFSGFHSLGALSPTQCRPFDRRRDGMVIGEGAGILVLEDLNHALKRGAMIYAEVLGYGFRSDASHITAPDSSGVGLANSILVALAEAELSPQDIDFISSHGVGTVSSDAMESKAIFQVFKDFAYQIPVSSTKPLTGHAMGASGAIEAALCALSITDQFIPGSLNHRELDPELNIQNVIAAPGQKKDVNAALSISSGVGGQNAALVLSRISVSRQQSNGKLLRSKTSVVVSGVGVVCPMGIGTTKSFEEAPDAASPFDRSSLECLVSATLNTALGSASESKLRQMDNLSRYAVLAAARAIEDAKIDVSTVDADQIGVLLGTAFGSIDSDLKYFRDLLLRNSPIASSPAMFRNTSANIAAAYVSIIFGLRGPNATISSGTTSGLQAISYSYDLLKGGMADIILAGEVEKIPLHVVDEKDAKQYFGSSLVPEGGAIVVLETRESAKKRGGRIYAEILGCGLADGQSDKTSAVDRAMSSALAEAGISTADVKRPDRVGSSDTYGSFRLIDVLRALQDEAGPVFSNAISPDGNAVSIVFGKNGP